MDHDWIFPPLFGIAFYVMGTLRSSVLSGGRAPNRFARTLRTYGTIWAVGEGYLMIGLRSFLEGTHLYEKMAMITIVLSLLWMGILGVIAVQLNRKTQAARETR